MLHGIFFLLSKMASEDKKLSLNFIDILKDRRQGSDFWWISRAISYAVAYNIFNYISPEELKENVLRSPQLKELVEDLVKLQKKPPDCIQLKAREIIEEVGYSHRHFVIRWLGFFLLKILKRILLNLFVSENQLLQIKSNMGTAPVVLIPTHRSYADFILVAFVCFNYGIEIPCVAAGIDFHGMWLMGKLLRNSKAFFMRRSFSDDSLYKKVFERYVENLITSGNSPVEFFIEGTRSRTNKAMMPKFGFLSMVLEAFYKREVPDITVVPVAISYERILEETLFSYELLGVPKPKETTSGLLRALSILDENYGNVFVNIGEGVSIRESLKGINFSSRSKLVENMNAMEIGHRIIKRQQSLQVLSCFNLIATGICHHLIARKGYILTIEKLYEEVQWIYSILKKMGATIHIEGTMEYSIKIALEQHCNLVKMTSSGNIDLVSSRCTKSFKRKMAGADLNDNTISEAVPVIMLQLYVNPCLHIIASPAIILLILESSTQPVFKDELYHKYRKLSGIFSYEFVFYSKWVHEDFEISLECLKEMGAIKMAENDILLEGEEKLFSFFQTMMYPFIIGHYYMCKTLLQCRSLKTESLILKYAQEVIENDIQNGYIQHHYPLSLNLLSNSLYSLSSIGAVMKKKNEHGVVFEIKEDTLKEAQDILGSLISKPEELLKRKKLDVISLNNKAKL